MKRQFPTYLVLVGLWILILLMAVLITGAIRGHLRRRSAEVTFRTWRTVRARVEELGGTILPAQPLRKDTEWYRLFKEMSTNRQCAVCYTGGQVSAKRIKAYQKLEQLDVSICLSLTDVDCSDTRPLALSQNLVQLLISGGTVPFEEGDTVPCFAGDTSALSELSNVGLDGLYVEAESLNSLRTLPNLETLSILNCKFTNPHKVELDAFRRLEHLTIWSLRQNDVSLLHSVSECRKVHYLDLSGFEITSTSLRRICDMQCLRTLRLTSIHLPRNVFDILRESQLRTLTLSQGQLPRENISTLKHIYEVQVW